MKTPSGPSLPKISLTFNRCHRVIPESIYPLPVPNNRPETGSPPNSKTDPPQARHTFGLKHAVLSLGITWWLTPASSFGVNYRYSVLDRFGVEGESSGVTGRLTIMLN
jgi:hypothetical protein